MYKHSSLLSPFQGFKYSSLLGHSVSDEKMKNLNNDHCHKNFLLS